MRPTVTNVDGNMKKHAGGNEICTATLDNALSISQKVKHKVSTQEN